MTSSLFFAAAASVCLAAIVWFTLIGARAARSFMLRRSRSSREDAARALVRFQRDRDPDALAKAWARVRTGELAAFLARALPMLDAADGEAARIVLRRSVFDRRMARAFARADEGLRLLYCELLAEIGGDDALGALQPALGDRAPTVRIAAAIALAELRAAPEIGALLATLGPETYASSRLVILFERLLPGQEWAIVRIASEESAEPRLRISALEALRLAGRAVHGRLLGVLADDPQAPVAVEVARALAFDDSPAAPAILARLLAHPAPEVRREAARAARRDGPELRRLLGDRDRTVASAAARSIWRLNPGPPLPEDEAERPPMRLVRP
ncbi:MAG TPA: HEAT repeat domain-containing protein [Allosphingosinicella sp.]|jgi:HEAT repeat protein|nr:HEAT repeat domain-containing protein [Allosphingosinicella sp.]